MLINNLTINLKKTVFSKKKTTFKNVNILLIFNIKLTLQLSK
jgi:hypothetical protein